jgi:hypothetical protein
VFHIDEDGEIKDQTDVIAIYQKSIGNDEPVQMSLWGEVTKPTIFASRKSYANKLPKDKDED